MDGFYVGPENMREQGRQIEQLGLASAEQFRSLQEVVAGDPSAWGSDEAGTAFGTAYQELVSAADEVLRLFSEGITTVGGNLQIMADDTQGRDETFRDEFDGIAGELREPT
jgi:hypothetical protein